MDFSVFLHFFENIILFALHLGAPNLFPKPLSKREEEEALKKATAGDKKARDLLIEHNLRLVAHIIKKYYSAVSEQDDLVSIGTIGLIKGINSFNAEKGTRLATYCSRCIENEILMYFRSQKKSSQDISMNEPIETDSEGNPLTLADIICTEDTIVDDLQEKADVKKVKHLVENIKNERDKTVIILRYGIGGGEPLTQQQVADLLGISRSYVSRIEKRVLDDMRSEFDDD